MSSAWTTSHVKAIASQNVARVPLITPADVAPLLPGIMLWDMWPVQNPDGSIAEIAGGSLWMALSAVDHGDPARRHFEARIRLLHRIDEQWSDWGHALPDQETPYEREWAGTALLNNGVIMLYFTAAGDAATPGGYQQKLYEAQGNLRSDGHIDWAVPQQSLINDGQYYELADQQFGEPGKIVAFRDPAYFRDPADGNEYLIFSASLAGSQSEYNGAVGIAKRNGPDGWALLPPIAHADNLNNEMERAHVVAKDGLYYLFWVTQEGTFNPHGPLGPTGLYGMVANSLRGEYRALNGSGLVLANPPEEPSQTYSWHVTKELLVSSFIDHWGLNGRKLEGDNALAAESFGGTPAPFLKLWLDGDRAGLVANDFGEVTGKQRA
ncbi:MAG: glycoside hydrolase family 68 protein [Parasphingorhabdus sp.]|nr:glycoside hydrolase family 68 protein [Parasphingorhabdus sp.]